MEDEREERFSESGDEDFDDEDEEELFDDEGESRVDLRFHFSVVFS